VLIDRCIRPQRGTQTRQWGAVLGLGASDADVGSHALKCIGGPGGSSRPQSRARR
jgi:hypothetical protein